MLKATFIFKRIFVFILIVDERGHEHRDCVMDAIIGRAYKKRQIGIESAEIYAGIHTRASDFDALKSKKETR